MSNREALNAPATEPMTSSYNLDDAELEAWLTDNESAAWNLERPAMSLPDQRLGC